MMMIITVAYRPVIMQSANKQTPVYMQRSRYCWTITMETVFSKWFVPKCCKQQSVEEVISSSVQ
jgi:hypothetical protein